MLQAALTLEASGAGGAGLPEPDQRVAAELAWFEQLRVWMRAFPPAQRDRAFQEQFGPLGVLDAESPYVDADPELSAALVDGLAAGKQKLEDALTHGASPAVRTGGS